MKVRKLSLILGSICLVLVFSVLPFVTACSTASTSTTTQEPVTVTKTVSTTATTTAKATVTATATTTATQAPVAVKEWDFPLITTLTGAMAAMGEMANWATQQAVAEINAAGGIRGVPVKVTAYDDAYSPTQAVSIAAKVIPGSLLLLGPANSNSDVAVAQLVSSNNIMSFGMTTTPAMRASMAPYGISCTSDMIPAMIVTGNAWLTANPSIKKVAILCSLASPMGYTSIIPGLEYWSNRYSYQYQFHATGLWSSGRPGPCARMQWFL